MTALESGASFKAATRLETAWMWFFLWDVTMMGECRRKRMKRVR
jgi:hypothetical protein